MTGTNAVLQLWSGDQTNLAASISVICDETQTNINFTGGDEVSPGSYAFQLRLNCDSYFNAPFVSYNTFDLTVVGNLINGSVDIYGFFGYSVRYLYHYWRMKLLRLS